LYTILVSQPMTIKCHPIYGRHKDLITKFTITIGKPRMDTISVSQIMGFDA